MPVDYSKAKIYKIYCPTSDNQDDIYIGSTCEPILSRRMVKHRADYNRWKKGKKGKVNSFDLFDKYGVKNCIIELIESYPCNSRDEISSREGYYIRNNKCVNKCITGRTKNEYYQDTKDLKKQYYEDHKEKILEKINCPCGGKYTYSCTKRHFRSKKHQNYIELLAESDEVETDFLNN